jgi:hypothetical protein
MKLVIMAFVAFAAIGASAQDTTGCKISANGKYATCKVLGGESGDQVQYVTFKIRGASAPVQEQEQCSIGEAGYGPCPTVYGVPQWLKDLNQAFADAGFSAPDTSLEDSIGGP